MRVFFFCEIGFTSLIQTIWWCIPFSTFNQLDHWSIVFVWATWRNCVFSSLILVIFIGGWYTHTVLSHLNCWGCWINKHTIRKGTFWRRRHEIGWLLALQVPSVFSEKTQLNYTYLTHNHQEGSFYFWRERYSGVLFNQIICKSNPTVISLLLKMGDYWNGSFEGKVEIHFVRNTFFLINTSLFLVLM